MRALFVLTPPESKRFIAKAVARLPSVLRAKVDGEIVIGHGSTNVRVAEEIMGDCPERDRFISGQVINGILCVTEAEDKPPMIVMRKGNVVPPKLTMEETLKDFNAESVFIKGANAVDPEGNAGVYVAHHCGGTIGYAYGILSARGCNLIVPVGLEKLVPSVKEAAQHLGQDTFYYCLGIKIGMIPLINAQVITEIHAFRILYGLEAFHVGGGGINGSEGSVTLVVEGKKERLDRAIELIESIKGEVPLRSEKARCTNCMPTTPSMIRSSEKELEGRTSRHCKFLGMKEEAFFSLLKKSNSE
ncbi:MAG: hypothetical protein K8R45_06130 [Desulfobacterales bacterium]|nr:hypothetical protein [Desulfobacterales bacterium]